MQQSEVISRIQNIFDRTFLESVVVVPQLTANDVDEWDSLSHISLILAIEEEFHIRFRVGEVEGTANVGQLADLIAKRSAA